MCDSRRPLNGADSGYDPLEDAYNGVVSETPHLHDFPTYPVWPTRAANDGWDQPEVPPSARALVGAGSRTGE